MSVRNPLNPSALARLLACSVLFALPGAVAADEGFEAQVDALLEPTAMWPGVMRSDVGVTRRGTRIPGLISASNAPDDPAKRRVLLVGGLEGDDQSVRGTMRLLAWFYSAEEAAPWRGRLALSAVPVANPDGWASGRGPDNLSGGDPGRGYPPIGDADAYASPTAPEAAYLWRWIGAHAPDLVVQVGQPAREADGTLPDDSLLIQLERTAPAGTGTVPAIAVDAPLSDLPQWFATLDAKLEQRLEADRRQGFPRARQELRRRLDRTPLEVAVQLSRHYGRDLDSVIDHPGSYREHSATCMIAFAMVRGVRRGWLDEQTFRPAIERAWSAILARTAPDGSLIDVCTGTGKQTSLRAYLDRPAILGRDARGGAMALLLAVELAGWRQEG